MITDGTDDKLTFGIDISGSDNLNQFTVAVIFWIILDCPQFVVDKDRTLPDNDCLGCTETCVSVSMGSGNFNFSLRVQVDLRQTNNRSRCSRE
jgi:hypothetical protein